MFCLRQRLTGNLGANLRKGVTFRNYLRIRVCFKTIHREDLFLHGIRHSHWRESLTRHWHWRYRTWHGPRRRRSRLLHGRDKWQEGLAFCTGDIGHVGETRRSRLLHWRDSHVGETRRSCLLHWRDSHVGSCLLHWRDRLAQVVAHVKILSPSGSQGCSLRASALQC